MTFKYYKSVASSHWQSQTKISINSKNTRKIKGLLYHPSNRSIVDSYDDDTLIHMFRIDQTNCGDWWSSSIHYFTFPSHNNVVEINDYMEDIPLQGTAIVGGGGLIGPAFKQLEHLVKSPLIKTIGWGLGNNMLDDKKHGYVSETVPLPEYVKYFDLLGIRDDIEGYRWVPCASCMHPAFSQKYDILYDIVIFEHKRIPIDIDGFPKMSNNGNDIEKIIHFLASGEIVLTNSYHGAYWALLLERKCVVFPFSSKFFAFKHPLVLGHMDDWKRLVSKACRYDEALFECREANIDFYKDTMRFIADMTK